MGARILWWNPVLKLLESRAGVGGIGWTRTGYCWLRVCLTVAGRVSARMLCVREDAAPEQLRRGYPGVQPLAHLGLSEDRGKGDKGTEKRGVWAAGIRGPTSPKLDLSERLHSFIEQN